MVDFLSPSERSERMSRIRSSNTSPELALRRALHALGFRFRLHRKDLPGKPDIVLPRHRTAIFVHGCFWHRHDGCKVASTPKSNTEFWIKKFDRNVARDVQARDVLEAQGWRVIVVWECELGSARKTTETAARVASEVRADISRAGSADTSE
ncbi:DNA mismatch endonuclease Vsr [Sinorhizobium meliloti]|uniref:very short patch repair endonuclease n=1 Tax=Rhizobium meliloti TaxID=382 RepID=UPI002380940B|nr:DNA mismatch endonuclease Vsr [Sinorhizobium meliloti]MDE3799575.1 DNA mismatch endonuclease Vsr [Sinorhizobium meliloti]